MNSFDWPYLWGEPSLRLLNGFYYTILLTFWSGLLALFIGMTAGIVSWLKLPALTILIKGYVGFIRNTPFVVQLLFVYFSAPVLLPASVIKLMQSVGFEFTVAIIALGVYHGAFFCEVTRSGLRSVPTGQMEGARALGLSVPFSLKWVMLPQAVRTALPALINEGISLAKNTSIAVAIGVAELTHHYRHIGNFDFRGVEALTVATVLYIILCLSISGAGMLISRAMQIDRPKH